MRNEQTAFDQRFSDQSRTTDASGREAHKAHAQLMAAGGTAPELLWESRRTGLLKGWFLVRFGRTRTWPSRPLEGVDGGVSWRSLLLLPCPAVPLLYKRGWFVLQNSFANAAYPTFAASLVTQHHCAA